MSRAEASRLRAFEMKALVLSWHQRAVHARSPCEPITHRGHQLSDPERSRPRRHGGNNIYAADARSGWDRCPNRR